MRRPEPGLERVWITAPEAARLVDLGNALYAILLTLLTHLFQDAANRNAVAGAAIDVMHALSRTGKALARLPASAEKPGVNAGLTFAVPRARGTRARISLLVERLGELAPEYERAFPGEKNPARLAMAKLEDHSAR